MGDNVVQNLHFCRNMDCFNADSCKYRCRTTRVSLDLGCQLIKIMFYLAQNIGIEYREKALEEFQK